MCREAWWFSLFWLFVRRRRRGTASTQTKSRARPSDKGNNTRVSEETLLLLILGMKKTTNCGPENQTTEMRDPVEKLTAQRTMNTFKTNIQACPHRRVAPGQVSSDIPLYVCSPSLMTPQQLRDPVEKLTAQHTMRKSGRSTCRTFLRPRSLSISCLLCCFHLDCGCWSLCSSPRTCSSLDPDRLHATLRPHAVIPMYRSPHGWCR